MRTAAAVIVGLSLTLTAGVAAAQEHWTEGPVWQCSAYRTAEGRFDDYMMYLRGNSAAIYGESKKQGLILDWKVYVRPPSRTDDWDVLVCSLFPSFAKALDYDAADEEKAKAVSTKHWKTADEQKQRELGAKRYELRRFLGTSYFREITLKPLQ
jgi:hypothetical protein